MVKWSRKDYYEEWRIWYLMKYRCGKNPHYPHYLDVTVCEDWQDWQQFMNDMGPRPNPTYSLDRIDPYGNYEPANCRWADKNTQARNKRDKQDRSEYWYWLDKAKENGISAETFRSRVGRMGLDWKYAATVKRVPGSGRAKKGPRF